MHRMQRRSAMMALALALVVGLGAVETRADLVRPAAVLAFPDVASGVHGEVGYTFSATEGSGVLSMRNTPYVFDVGVYAEDKYAITADAAGRRVQSLTVRIDADGNLVADAANKYELFGEVTYDGTTYSGLLLSGTPSAFGSQDLSSLGLTTTDIFDADIVITGGELAELFGGAGAGLYLRFRTDLDQPGQGFTGSFTDSFQSYTPTSFLIPVSDPATPPGGGGTITPQPVPEPASVLLAVAGGLGLRFRRRLQARLLDGCSRTE